MPSLTRRSMLTAAAGSVALGASARALPSTFEDAQRAAQDEAFWSAVAGLYDVTGEVIHLEHGNWGMMARPVLEAHIAHVEAVNRRNSYYARREFWPDAQAVQARIAAVLGCEPDEIVLTRNATEALQALIGGYNRLSPGDGVLYADLDYGSMQTAMAWLRERRGADLVTMALPEPATRQSLIDAYEQALIANPHVRLMLVTHLSHRTGLVLPVAEICEMARGRSVDVIVDAAHSWGQIDFTVAELNADFVGFNLHKWIGAPLGVGLMYVRKPRIADIDPFMGEPSRGPQDIGARVHTGTTDFAAILSVPAALDVHEAIGPARKAARLRYLRSLWTGPAREAGFEVLTPEETSLHAGITSFRAAGQTGAQENAALAARLLNEHNIFTVHRTGIASGACVRVTPGVFTSPDDVRALAEALPRLVP
ncbi:isopenicillin-N epimerase [Marinicauda pacifica]|uniref:Aminotransferase class V-fold PLP-dependent enzyme n=1 Tax=Marinicauda pacifica TaxID=1133559 RepID=A0A4S2H9X1_9PROT|nr:aminotransferase class V-fold PLP-dependent enzyme [Marinicauda pacifica]TGY92361.1 aminotransferase class V-fold PLP-dependent enzyme [Marinicauda pacifica]GGE48246.1 isopenicillin-N epimerase [Marinicauda pacifica]